MSRRCTVCDSSRVEEINLALVHGKDGYRVIAGQFGLAPTSVQRHQQKHLPRLLRDAEGARQRTEANLLWNETLDLYMRLVRRLELEDQNGPHGMMPLRLRALCAIHRELRGYLELFVRMRSMLPTDATDALDRLITAYSEPNGGP